MKFERCNVLTACTLVSVMYTNLEITQNEYFKLGLGIDSHVPIQFHSILKLSILDSFQCMHTDKVIDIKKNN